MDITKIHRIGACAAVLSLALVTGLAGQTSQPVSGPVLGFVLEKTVGIRPILGIPGAATLGRPILPVAGYDSIVFSPQQDYALALTQGERQVVLLRELSASVRAYVLNLAPGVERIVISPTGDSAAFYYIEARRVVVLTGLPGSPAVSWGLELPELAGGLAALAVSDGGSAVLAAAGGEEPPVFLVTPETGSRYLLAIAGSPSVTFLVKSLDAVVADGALKRIFLVRDPKGQPRITQLASELEGLSRPIAVAAAADNRRVFVANAEPAGVLSLSLSGEDPAAISCDCKPTGLERLSGDATFRLSDLGEGPLWLLDGASSPPRIVFVPYQAAAPAVEVPLAPAPASAGVVPAAVPGPARPISRTVEK